MLLYIQSKHLQVPKHCKGVHVIMIKKHCSDLSKWIISLSLEDPLRYFKIIYSTTKTLNLQNDTFTHIKILKILTFY